jgi:hypothetical protein
MTLTEVIIALGLLLTAVYCAYRVLGTALQVGGSSGRYLQAVYACSGVVARVQGTPLSELPPALVRLDAPKALPLTIKLPNTNIVPDSESLRWAEGGAFEGEYRLEPAPGTLTVRNAARTGVLVVGYAFEPGESSAMPNSTDRLGGSRIEVAGRAYGGAPALQAPKHLTAALFWTERGRERCVRLETLKVR